MYLETHTGAFVHQERSNFDHMSRSELVEHLELRGFACYDNESTSLLRETAIEDFDEEERG
jgi:hypothetical protein